jgi:hypothetical protein
MGVGATDVVGRLAASVGELDAANLRHLGEIRNYVALAHFRKSVG